MVTHAVGTMRNTALQDNAQTIAKKENSLSFPDVFSAVRGANRKASENAFSAAFPANDVRVKVGDCKVDDKIWQRKDFPAWRYFQEGASADCLNHWKPTGKSATGKEAYIQSELKKVGYGKMVTIVPEGLQEKMDADPEFARQVAEKVQDWKINYDKMDDALAASYGDNPAWYQMTKSYCLQLDEKGNVKNYMVVSGGTDTKKSSGTGRADTQMLQNSLARAITQMTLQSGAASMMSGFGGLGYAGYGGLGYTGFGGLDYAGIAPFLYGLTNL